MPMTITYALFQFEIHKYCNGDNSEEYDKYFNSYWRVVYFWEAAESESVDRHVCYGMFMSFIYTMYN